MAGADPGPDKSSEQVKVVVRCRPMNTKEFAAGYNNVVNVSQFHNMIHIHDPKDKESESKLFTFDAVYDFTSSQEQVYKESVKPIVDSVLDGYNATIFAYGQTGTGKTHTMEGKQFDRKEKGVIPRSFSQIFDHFTYYSDLQYVVRCSYIELYQEEIRDLLDKTGKKTYELKGDHKSVYIKNLNSYVCRSAVEMDSAMKFGNNNRKTGATDMNERSSRSHAIFTITIQTTRMISDFKQVKIGKLNLVDLAGSERIAKSKSSGIRLKEATKINLSLSALSNVISALSKERNAHIPYRDSKLTRILQDSLGGNAKTLMIANIGPACYNYTESLNTLKYANRAKNIKNKPFINEDLTKDELIEKCQIEVERLKALVREKYPHLEMKAAEKMNRDKEIEEKTILLEEAINNEEIRFFRTCQRVEYLRQWKNQIEHLVGSDIRTLTNWQQNKLKEMYSQVQKVETSKKKLKQQIELETQKALHYQYLYMKLPEVMVNNFEVLHKTYNKVVGVKNKTLEINKKFDEERNELEADQRQLLKHYKINEIINQNFIPDKTRRDLIREIKEKDPSKWTVSSKFHYIPVPRLHSSRDQSNQNKTNFRAQNSTRRMGPGRNHRSSKMKRDSKFKNNIVIRTNRLGIKQFIELDSEQPGSSSSEGSTPSTRNINQESERIGYAETMRRLQKLLEKY